jgi:cell division initiation protein
MALTPVEIRHLKIGKRLFGYSKDETDRLLLEIVESFEDVWRDRADLADKIEKLEGDLVRFRDTEALLRTTLVSAEKAAAEHKDVARREAEVILKEAHAASRQVTRGSLSELQRLQAEARRIRSLLQSALMVVEPALADEPAPAPLVQDTWEQPRASAAGAA